MYNRIVVGQSQGASATASVPSLGLGASLARFGTFVQPAIMGLMLVRFDRYHAPQTLTCIHTRLVLCVY